MGYRNSCRSVFHRLHDISGNAPQNDWHLDCAPPGPRPQISGQGQVDQVDHRADRGIFALRKAKGVHRENHSLAGHSVDWPPFQHSLRFQYRLAGVELRCLDYPTPAAGIHTTCHWLGSDGIGNPVSHQFVSVGSLGADLLRATF